jgi:hypothetical protein
VESLHGKLFEAVWGDDKTGKKAQRQAATTVLLRRLPGDVGNLGALLENNIQRDFSVRLFEIGLTKEIAGRVVSACFESLQAPSPRMSRNNIIGLTLHAHTLSPNSTAWVGSKRRSHARESLGVGNCEARNGRFVSGCKAVGIGNQISVVALLGDYTQLAEKNLVKATAERFTSIASRS